MPERTDHAPGTPSWVDIGTDVAAAKDFYGPLFGWTTQDAGPPEQTGGYGFFLKDGRMVAGYGPQQNPGPPSWATYVSVVDAQATAKRAEAAGGTVVMAPMEVMGAGMMAVLQDSQGAFISLWQPAHHRGAQMVNEPGALCWNELAARQVEAARDFYRAVFDWEPVTHEGPMTYTEFQLEGQSVAGMMPMPAMVPAEVPSHWLVYFGVDDTDAAVARTQELGGSVRMPPMDIPVGRFAVLADSRGATFAVIALSQSS